MKTNQIQISYKTPYDFQSLLAWFRFHQIPDLELVEESSYSRLIPTASGLGAFRVIDDKKAHSLQVEVKGVPSKEFAQVEATVRRMFDVDADPMVIGQALGKDADLKAVWARFPGLRVARAWSGYESIITTILGQLVSLSFGRLLVRELMVAAGSKAKHPQTGTEIHLFPTPELLLAADLAKVRTSPLRRKAILSVAEMVTKGAFDWVTPIDPKMVRKTLRSIPGVGVWTAEYVAMRGFHDDNAFPATDYGLLRELERLPRIQVERVQPWRAYAAAALWRSYGEAKKITG